MSKARGVLLGAVLVMLCLPSLGQAPFIDSVCLYRPVKKNII